MMNATNNYNNSKVELDYLINVADEIDNNDNIKKTSESNKKVIVINKAIVLLLCAKLERFVKDITNEYIIKIKGKNLKSKQLPAGLKEEIYKMEYELINDHFHNYFLSNDNKKYAENFALFWDDNFVIKNLRDNFSISISNNGTTEFKKIFKKIDFPDLLDNIPDLEYIEEVASVESVSRIGIVERINKIIKIRNNIIHEDVNPNITNKDIKIFLAVINQFVDYVDTNFENKLNSL